MPRNQVSVEELRCRIIKLKNSAFQHCFQWIMKKWDPNLGFMTVLSHLDSIYAKTTAVTVVLSA